MIENYVENIIYRHAGFDAMTEPYAGTGKAGQDRSPRSIATAFRVDTVQGSSRALEYTRHTPRTQGGGRASVGMQEVHWFMGHNAGRLTAVQCKRLTHVLATVFVSGPWATGPPLHIRSAYISLRITARAKKSPCMTTDTMKSSPHPSAPGGDSGLIPAGRPGAL